MRWAAVAIAGALAASSGQMAFGQAADTAPTEQARALIAKPPLPEDLFRLKRDMGAERFRALNIEIVKQTFRPSGDIKPGERVTLQACDPAGQRLIALTQLAMATDDEGAWRARLAEAEGALKKRSALSDAAIQEAEQRVKASGSSDAWRVELARRVGRDQFVRSTMPGLSPPGGWSDGVSGPVQQYLTAIALAEMCAVDQDNTAWLKAEIARRGWPRISREGKDADNQAWLLVQHADLDPAWQAQVLAQLGELAPTGETNPRNYAYLFDRVAMKHSGPQRYGTQGHCTGVGIWEPFADEPGDLDARRKSVGLPSEAEYIAGFKTRCFKADGV